MWIFDYLPSEVGAKLYKEPIQIERQGIKLFIGHGDGLGPGDHGYKFIKKVFANKLCQWLFARLHPNFGIGLANFFSEHHDYFIFGHRHLPMEIKLNEKSKYVNLGDWINHYTYAKLANGQLELVYHDKP